MEMIPAKDLPLIAQYQKTMLQLLSSHEESVHKIDSFNWALESISEKIKDLDARFHRLSMRISEVEKIAKVGEACLTLFRTISNKGDTD